MSNKSCPLNIIYKKKYGVFFSNLWIELFKEMCLIKKKCMIIIYTFKTDKLRHVANTLRNACTKVTANTFDISTHLVWCP